MQDRSHDGRAGRPRSRGTWASLFYEWWFQNPPREWWGRVPGLHGGVFMSAAAGVRAYVDHDGGSL